MKLLGAFVLLFYLAALDLSGQTTNDAILTFTNNFEGRMWIFDVGTNDFEKAPKWNAHEIDSPPLATGKAILIAEKFVGDLFVDKSPRRSWIGVTEDSVTLHRLPISGEDWYYSIHFYLGRGGFATNTFDVIVMMDGKIPSCREIKKVNQKP